MSINKQCPEEGCQNEEPTYPSMSAHLAGTHHIDKNEAEERAKSLFQAGPEQNDETTDQETETMSTEHDHTTEDSTESIKNEISRVMPGKDQSGLLEVRRVSLNGYRVLSARNGSVEVYEVSLSEPSCTCEDWQYNVGNDPTRNVCTHYVAAFIESDSVTTDDVLTQDLASMVSATQEAYETMAEAREQLQYQTGGSGGDVQSNQPQSNSGGSVDASQKASELQEAIDYWVEGFDVTAEGGFVWINKTPDAPDEMPGPGSRDTFDVLLREPEQTTFIAEDADKSKLPGEFKSAPTHRPSEWHKNAILPSDVDDYINEVL